MLAGRRGGTTGVSMENHDTGIVAVAVLTMVAALAGIALHRLRQPPIVGYILAGVVMGPGGLGLIADNANIRVLAELGVIMLLFVIGMEVSLKAFVLVLRVAVLTTAGQLTAALGLAALAGWAFGWSPAAVVLMGFIFAMSSTAVAMTMLDDLHELRSETGQTVVGVMIAQDIAVVPMLIIVAAMGGQGFSGSTLAAVILAVLALAVFIRVLTRRGKLVLPFAESLKAQTGLLTLSMVAFCFGAAAISGTLGLSPAYGAFMAGLVIAHSNLRVEAIRTAEPVQSILLVVFFLSIGLLIDLAFISQRPWTIALLVLGGLAVKSVLNVALLRALGQPYDRALPAGLIMAQVGEFSFILAALGLSNRVIDAETHQLAISVIALSLLLSPLWMSMARRFHDAVEVGVLSWREAMEEAWGAETDWLARRRRLVRVAYMRLRRRWRQGKKANDTMDRTA